MKYICLMIDYRTPIISWWDWTDDDKEGTEFNLFTGERALYTCYKIKNTIFDIYKTLITDMWANEKVLHDTKENTILYGDKFIMNLDEKRIYIRSSWMKDEYKIFRTNKETGELEQL